eukprot:scaffold13285_cov103-Isochrysis_galbana.AAC.1
MERSPADARVAPTAAGSADNNVKVPTSPKRQRETAPMKKKIFRRKRYSLAATWLGSSALLPSGHSPSPTSGCSSSRG